MPQLELILQTLEVAAVVPEPVNQRPVQRYKPATLRGPDGRIKGCVKRSRAEFVKSFWERVKKGGENDCWEWQGGLNGHTLITQYGICWWGNKKHKTHRLSYELANGPIADGLCVLHRCDNPKCVNPNHLFLGTNMDNILDKLAKGRQGSERGEDRYNAKLTEDNVREIRRRYIPRHPQHGLKALGKEFGVYDTMISAIVTRRRWKHVAHSENGVA